MAVASLIESVLGPDVPVGFRAYDGSAYGPPDALATIVVRSPNALRRIVIAPGELGFARAYVKTLRHWVANLEARWDEAVTLVGESRARIWRLYMAGSAMNFEANRTQIHQVLGVKPDDDRSCFPWRPSWEPIS